VTAVSTLEENSGRGKTLTGLAALGILSRDAGEGFTMYSTQSPCIGHSARLDQQ
jgi:hypothetical protein